MAASKVSTQEWKDLDKFIKFLALKTVQIIVQSRLGEKTKTKSKPHSSGADWFNLAVRDIPEVQTEAKKTLTGMVPSVGLNVCVEISLKTIEGDSMVLETWCLSTAERCDSSARVTHTVYGRMGLLLKSLISVTRVTPAYKLAGRQGTDSFVICYRVYLGEAELRCLGENYLHVRVGQVNTPVGSIMLSVAYRTQLTLTPQKASERECLIMVKSDHFQPDLSPRRPRHPMHVNCQPDHRSMVDELAAACSEGQDNDPSVTTARRCLGFGVGNGYANEWKFLDAENADQERHDISRKCPSLVPNNLSLLTLGAGATRYTLAMLARTGKRFVTTPLFKNIASVQHESVFQIQPFWKRRASFSETKKVGAFVEVACIEDATGKEFLIPEAPFGSLLVHHDADNNLTALNQPGKENMTLHNGLCNEQGNKNFNNNINNNFTLANITSAAANKEVRSNCSSSVDSSLAGDDFVLVELKPPFAAPDCVNDLGTFYRECQAAPPLASFGDLPSLADQVVELGNQLANFEIHKHEFDELVDALNQGESAK